MTDNEIYEGDIIYASECYVSEVYCPSYTKGIKYEDGGYSINSVDVNMHKIKVIGNIYEHRELLKNE